MHALMSEAPLLVGSLLEHAARSFPSARIVSRGPGGSIHRCGWRDVRRRVHRVARGLRHWGLERGDRAATLAWNHTRHLELYYGVPEMGGILHPLNPRLHPSRLRHILDRAGDRVLFVDPDLLPLARRIRDGSKTVERLVVLTEGTGMDQAGADAVCYEEWLDATELGGRWAEPTLREEDAAGICFTSGTTGDPKGAVYSHRSTVLHAMGISLPGGLGIPEDGVVLPAVPMFHVMAWGIPYAAAVCGWDLVLPGPRLDGPSLTALMNEAGVTCICGVPTLHLSLLDHWEETGERVPTLRTVVSGGAAPSPGMIDAFHDHGVEVVHSWGMTETSPVGTMSRLGRHQKGLDREARTAHLLKQGRPLFGVELRTVDATGAPLPRDGETVGELQVRGLWVISAYLGDERGSALDEDGWFSTGDMATLDETGTLRITDRRKDLIKSGGEWISSIDLENVAAGHPSIDRAAVVGIPHRKWGERPLLVAVARGAVPPSLESVRAYLETRVPRWWIPDEIVFVDALPLGGTGKVQKDRLRERYGPGE